MCKSPTLVDDDEHKLRQLLHLQEPDRWPSSTLRASSDPQSPLSFRFRLPNTHHSHPSYHLQDNNISMELTCHTANTDLPPPRPQSLFPFLNHLPNTPFNPLFSSAASWAIRSRLMNPLNVRSRSQSRLLPSSVLLTCFDVAV